MKKTTNFLITLGILAVTAIVITALVCSKQDRSEDRFSVSGLGTIYVKADIANLEVGLRTKTEKTAALATQNSTEKMKNIINSLKELGIEEKDIKTSNYNLNPVYNYTQARGQELVGYEVYQTVNVKIRDLDKIGEVIAKTTEQGANQIGNINFTIDDEFELKNQAREIAIEKAKEKAALMAEQTGMKLGKIKGVSESYYDFVVPMSTNFVMKEMAMAGDESISPSIEAGQNEVRVEIVLSYEVK